MKLDAEIGTQTSSWLLSLDLGTVASCALARRRFIEENQPSFHLALERVTKGASNIPMGSVQPVIGLYVVVEGGGLPFQNLVTHGAIRLSRACRELAAMNIFVAGIALFGRRLEYDVSRPRGQVVRFVAPFTWHGAMRPFQREAGGGVIKSLHFLPGFRVVTRAATGDASAGHGCLHALRELTLMRIVVTGGARRFIKAEPGGRSRGIGLPVALGADYRRVSAGQGKARLGVACRRECRRLECPVGMAILATIGMRDTLKLPGMDILMAPDACDILEPVSRPVGRRGMTLGACCIRMAPAQRKPRCLVLLDTEFCRFEALNQVAYRAIASVGPGGELPPVRLFFMAIGTSRERHRLLEVTAQVAQFAGQIQVLPFERVSGRSVVENVKDGSARYLPVGQRVTAAATGAETALVLILVAGGAVLEGDPLIFDVRLGILDFRMAFIALHLFVRSGQSEARAPMIEPGGVFPAQGVMTIYAVTRKLAAMLVVMAACAFVRESEIGAAEILR
jgi:hypothetical protein